MIARQNAVNTGQLFASTAPRIGLVVEARSLSMRRWRDDVIGDRHPAQSISRDLPPPFVRDRDRRASLGDAEIVVERSKPRGFQHAGHATRRRKHAEGRLVDLADRGQRHVFENLDISRPRPRFGDQRRDEFQQIVAGHDGISLVDGLGLKSAQGMTFVNSTYWDLNDGTRAFGRRFADRMRGRMPSDVQAGVYAGVSRYLKTIRQHPSHDGKLVVGEMKKLPTDDPLFGRGRIREDGRVLHDIYVFEVKGPAESTQPYDYYKRIATIGGEQAFRPMLKECDFSLGQVGSATGGN
ncbi:MAG: ABC transporter substrate-binding protein [Xanthobacteraceae bacterium]|nr:ABC transporter substrate-binding protein [Xanthobacteraceae bacterium]